MCLQEHDPLCLEARYLLIYGAEGNLALKSMSLGEKHGGGIAPKLSV
jgi:hypothetical protein